MDEMLTKAKEEIVKGNDIIRKLQDELKTSKSKVKLKNALVLQQEKLLDERAHIIDTIQKEALDGKAQLEKVTSELEQAKETIDTLSNSLEEKKQTVQDNANGTF